MDNIDFEAENNDFTVKRNVDGRSFDVQGISYVQAALIVSAIKISHGLADISEETPGEVHDAIKHLDDRFYGQMVTLFMDEMTDNPFSNTDQRII